MKAKNLYFFPFAFLLIGCCLLIIALLVLVSISYIMPTTVLMSYATPTQVSMSHTTPLPPTLPPAMQALDGLTYANMNTAQIFRIASGSRGVAILQGTSARFSSDGILALFESSGDIFLAEPMDNPGVNVTHTPDRLESNPQLWISHPDGNDAYRLGLATNPIWSPDLKHLAYVQWPPRSDSYLAATASMIEVPSWDVQQINLPAGSIPLAWTLP